MIPTLKQRVQLVGEERAFRETEVWIDALVAENKKFKFQQDQLRLVLGSGEPLHVDYDTLLELATLFKADLKRYKDRVAELENKLNELRRMTFRIYGEDLTAELPSKGTIIDACAHLLLASNDKSDVDKFEFYDTSGNRLMPFTTVASVKGDLVVASLPIGHGG